MNQRILSYLALLSIFMAVPALAEPTYINAQADKTGTWAFTSTADSQVADTGECSGTTVTVTDASSQSVVAFQTCKDAAGLECANGVGVGGASSPTPVNITHGFPYLKMFVTTDPASAGTVDWTCRRTGWLTPDEVGIGAGSPPDSGIDTSITMYENSDHTGDDTYKISIAAETDLLASHTNFISALGVATDRIIPGFVDSTSVLGAVAGKNEGYVRMGTLYNADDGVGNSNLNRLVVSTALPASAINGTGVVIQPLLGGRLQGKALTVKPGTSQTSATNDECQVTVRYNTAIAAGQNFPNLDPTVAGPDADWAACTGHVEFGPTSNNEGQTNPGIGDDVVNGAGTGFTVALTDCTCPTTDCGLVVAVEERVVDACIDVDEIYIGLAVGEVFP